MIARSRVIWNIHLVTFCLRWELPWWNRDIRHGNSVAYAENFHGGGSFTGMWWSFVFGVRCLWRHNLTSYSCFKTKVLAKFV